MDSSAAAAAAAYLLRHSSSSSHHFLQFFSSPPPETSSAVSASDDFNESELFWTADFGSSSNNYPFRSRRISSDDRASSFIPPPNSGILAALTDDSDYDRKQRIGTILTRETSMAKSSSSSMRSIPRPVQSNRDYSQSVPCRKFQRSAPINVPEAMRKQRNNEEISGREEEMLPPHETVARGSGVSPNTTFSVLEGAGRTLKGRDLRRVRNAVWHRTGFVD